MNEKFLELYEYLKSEGITDLSPEDFYNAYKDPNKAKDVYDFVSSEEMTDLNENDFFSAYFGTEVKKKDDSEVVTDTSEVVTDTSEVSESEVLSTGADETSETEEAVTPPINFDELTYFDFSSINRAVNGVEFSDDNIGHLSESKEEELLDLNINPHIQSLVSIGANMPEDANVAVTELSPSEKKTYDFNFSRYQKVLDNQNKVKEVNVQKGTNTGQYGFNLADASLPGLIPSLEGFGPFGGETTYNPVPGEDNYSNDPEVIAKAKVILDTDLPRARNKIIRIFKNKKKSYGLPSDITTATDEQLAEAFKKFNKENTYAKTGKSITTTMPISGGTSTEPTYEKDYININKKYLEKIFNNQFLVAKNNAQIELDKKVDEEKRTAIQNADSSILSRDVIGKRIYDFHKDYDYNNNMSTEEQRYSDAETVLEGLEVQLKKLTAEEKTPDDELITEWEKAKAELASAQKGLGDDIHPLYDPLTGERTDKLEGALDLTEQIKRHEKDALTFKGNIKNRYVTVSNREEDHRIMGGLMTRDLIVKDPRRWQKRANQEGFIIEPSDDGKSFIIKGVPLSKIGLYTSDILNKEVKNEAEEWNDKNAENIASRKVWMKMALTNIDPGKVDKSKTARFFEVLAGDGALAASFGMSDQKFVDFSVDEFTKAGIPLSPSLIKNMKRTWGMELTEQGAGFLPIAAQMWLGNKVLGAVGFAGWLKNTVQGLNTAKKFQRWNKFRGFILEASVEEVKMQTYGFHDGTGFGFTMAGRFMPAAGIFKFKGELARLNTVGNVVFDSGLKGAFALEFAGHVEAIVEDVKGGSAYGTFMEEQYPDVSTVGRRVILSGALFSIYGGMGLFGKGRSGMNIKNMESVVKELKQKGYNEEALKIQKNVDLYYEGKKKLSKEEQDILTENENGKGKEYNTDLTEAELKQRLKDMGGREVKPEAEVKAEEVKAEEVKVEEVKTTSETRESLEREVQKTWEELENTPETKFKKRRELNKKLDELIPKYEKLEAEVKPEAEVKEVEIPSSYNEKMKVYKQSDLGGGKGGKVNEKSDLVKEAETPEGKEYVKQEVEKLEKNEDGTITVYRVGNLNEGHNPTTTSKKTAETIAKERKAQGLSSQIIETNVKAEDISVVVPGVEAEIFVKVTKENQSRINENSNTLQEGQSLKSLQQRINELQKDVEKTEKDLTSGKIKGDIYTNSIKKKKTEISNLEKQINKKKSDSKSEKLTKLREEAAKSLNFKPEVKEVKVEETTGKEVKVEETTGKEVKEPEKEVVVPEKEVVEILLNKKDGVFAGIWNRGGFSASNKAGDKDAHSANTRKVQEKSEELQKLESNNPKVNEGEFSVSGTFEGSGYRAIVGKERGELSDIREKASQTEKMFFNEQTLENGDVVYSLINGKHRVRNREGYYAVNLTYKKGTEVKLNDVKNLLTTKMNDITTIITGVKSTVKPKVEPKVEPTVKEVTESIEEVKVEDSKSTNPSFEKGSMRNFSVDGGVLEIGRVNNASLSSILKLEVEKDSRRQGKAEVLLKRALNETKGELSGQASNDAAVALNYKLGMRVNGNETLSLKESQSERAQSAGESVSMVLPKNKRGDNYKPFKVEPTVKEKVIEPTVEPEYTKNNIINIKDPTDVLIQAKQKRKLANQKYNKMKDSLTEKQKNQFREESLKINNLIKNLEAEIVEKGVTGEKGEKEIQQYADKVIEGLESAKKTLKESGLTYSFILPGVNAKTLSVALDIGIASVKATKSAVIGLNKFKNSILTQLNIKKLTKAQEKQLNDFFNRNYDLSKQKVLSYTREIIKENKLDNVDSFIKEMESDPMFKKYDKQDLILLYNNSIKGSTLQLTNIKEKTENLKKGFFKGKTEEYKFTKQSKIEMDNVITEFNQFVETLDGSITASKETMRIIGNIKNKETLQTAINRIEELMSDKKVVEQVQEKENVINKITSLTNIKEGEGKVKKSLSGGININPTTKLTKEQSAKLSTINTKLDNINKIIKDVSNKKTGIESEIKYSQEMVKVLESIERYETSTSEGFVSVSKGGIKNDKQLENAYLRLEELEFYNIYNLEVKSGNNSSLTNLMTKVEQFQTEGKSLSTILRKERAIEKAKIKEGAVVALKWDGSNFAKWWKKKFKTKETFTEDFNKGRTWYDVSGEKSHYNIIRTIDMFNNKDGKGVDYYKKNVYESYFDANRNKMKDEMALTNEMNAEISKIYGITKGKGNIFTTKSTYITAEVGAKLTELGISKKQPFTQINFEGKTETVFKSDFGMLELWLIAKNPLEKAPLERMGWTPEKLKDLDNHLSPKLKKLGEFMMEKLNGERYDKYSARYQENKGIGLPREASAPYYWPRRPDEAWSNIGKSEPSWDNSSWNNFSSTIQVGHHKSRTSTAPFKYDNAIATYMGYINKMEHYHHFQKPVEIYSTVFKDPAVRQSLNKNFGTSYTQAMDRHIDKMKGEFSAKGWEVFDAFSLQFSKNVLSASPAIAVKQAASSVIFASVTPLSYTIKSALSGGQYVKNIDAKTTSAYMMRKYRRYELGYNELSQQNIFFNESFLVKKSIKGQETFNRAFGSNVDLSKPARKFSSFNKKYVEPAAGFLSQRGDKAGMTWLGQGYLDYKYDYYASRKNETTGKLYTKKEATIEAVRDYEMLALSTQQTDMAMETSRWRQDMGSFGKLLTTFTTSMSAVREFTVLSQQEMINGKNVKQNAKKVAVSSVLLGTIFAFLNNGTLSDEKDVAYAIAKTNIQGFMFAGKVIDNMKGMDRYKPSSQVPFESHVYKIRGLYLNNKKSNDKWEKQIDDYALGKINLTEKELNVLRLENKQRKDKYLKSLGLELSVFGLPISLKNINKIATNAESAYYNEMKLQHLNKQLLLLTSKSKENISAEDIVETSLAKKVLLLNPSKYQEGKTVLELFTGQEKHPDEWFTLRNTLNDNWEQVMAIEKFKKNNAEPYDTDKFLEYYILNKNYKTSEEKIRKEQMELLKILELRDMKNKEEKEEKVNPVEEMRRQKILKPVK